MKYCPEAIKLSQIVSGCKGVGSIGLDIYSIVDSKIRSSVESVITWHLMTRVYEALKEMTSKALSAYGRLQSSLILSCEVFKISSKWQMENNLL